MKIALDATCLGRRKTGNETYVRGLLHGMQQLKVPGCELHVLTTEAHQGERAECFEWINLPEEPFLSRHLWTIPATLKRRKPDLYHASYWTRFWAEPVPSILTVHDISYDLHPEWYGWQHHTFMARYVREAARRARHVLTVSEFSKHELMEHWRIPEDQITVTYDGVDACYRPPGGGHAGSREQGAGSQNPTPHAPGSTLPYILYVGNLHPRKNLPRLLEAFVQLKEETNLPHTLKIVGQKAWLFGNIFETVRRHKLEDAVEFTGYVSQDELVSLYQNAAATAYPSLYEGFGLPVLEAMACGSPVVCSSTTSIPEVAGTACRLVDPTSADSIAQGLQEVLALEGLRTRMRAAGLEQARRFTWRACAERTWEAYGKTLAH